MIYIRFKKKGWTKWVTYPCHTEEEAERVRSALREQGYEVEG